jgi:hypothetical protein
MAEKTRWGMLLASMPVDLGPLLDCPEDETGNCGTDDADEDIPYAVIDLITTLSQVRNELLVGAEFFDVITFATNV